MEGMVKYAMLMMMLLAFAVASSASDYDNLPSRKYTAVMKTDIPVDSKCTNKIGEFGDRTALIPGGIWTDSEDSCIIAVIQCTSGCDPVGALVGVRVVGRVPEGSVEDDGNIVIISKFAFDFLDATPGSPIQIKYIIPPPNLI